MIVEGLTGYIAAFHQVGDCDAVEMLVLYHL